MPIHTVDVIHGPILDSCYVQELMISFGVPKYKINKIMKVRPEKLRDGAIHPLSKNHPLLGIKTVRILRFASPSLDTAEYYFIMKLEPQMMIEGRHTINLFVATEENRKKLLESFHSAMNQFMDDKEFPGLVDLANWNCLRIDYTQNLKFDTHEEAKLLLKLSKKTSRYIRRNKKILSIDDPEQSTAEANKSSKVLIYEKLKQILETYGGISEADMKRLLKDATGVIRYEVQCKKGKVASLKRSRKLASRGVMNFLDEDIANDLLIKSYRQTIGEGDFFQAPQAHKKIESSSHFTSMKNKLYNTMRLIAQARSLYNGYQQFIEGGHKLRNTQTIVAGTSATFRNRLKALAAIGVNPCMIPKQLAEETGIKMLHNPLDQIG